MMDVFLVIGVILVLFGLTLIFCLIISEPKQTVSQVIIVSSSLSKPDRVPKGVVVYLTDKNEYQRFDGRRWVHISKENT